MADQESNFTFDLTINADNFTTGEEADTFIADTRYANGVENTPLSQQDTINANGGFDTVKVILPSMHPTFRLTPEMLGNLSGIDAIYVSSAFLNVSSIY